MQTGRCLNEPSGHLLRAKLWGVDEGGVAAGYAYLSSPLLCDDAPHRGPVTGGAAAPAPLGFLPMGVLKRQRSDDDPDAV